MPVKFLLKGKQKLEHFIFDGHITMKSLEINSAADLINVTCFIQSKAVFVQVKK